VEPSPHEAPSPPSPTPQANGADLARAPSPTPSPLKLAIRKARLDDAERTNVVAELRGAEIARLEMLRDEILPVASQIPQDVDLFDVGLAATERPRLFIDMIGFVEMGHDRRTYRFVQDTRHGRVVIAESERMEPIVDAVTDYIARRLVEREKALAADGTLKSPASANAEMPAKIAARHPPAAASTQPAEKTLGRLLAVLVELLGTLALLALLGLGGFAGWKYAYALWLAKHGG
jgi:hypothetical protein